MAKQVMKDEAPPIDPPPIDEAPIDPPPIDEAPIDPPPIDEAPIDPPPIDEAPIDPPPIDEAPIDPPPIDEAPSPNSPSAYPMREAPRDGRTIFLLRRRRAGDEWIPARWVQTRMRDHSKRVWEERAFWTDCRVIGNRAPIDFDPTGWKPS
jgi:hypothetical protein